VPTTTELEPARRTDDQPILSTRAVVPRPDAEAFIAASLHDIRVFMQEHHIAAAGPPFSVCRPRGGDLDIEVGWPTATKALAGTGRIHAGSLPRSLAGTRAGSDAGDPVEPSRGRRLGETWI